MVDMDKTRLAAFVDGELSPEEAAAVVLHLADHPADQAYVDDLFAANLALQKAFSAPMHDPVPEAIRRAIMGPDVLENPAPTAKVLAFRPRQVLVWGGLAVAASVALGVAVLPAMMTGPSAGYALGPLPDADPMHGVLETRASGEPLTLADGRQAMVLATFQMPDGRFCREFEMIEAAAQRIDIGLGCRTATGWQVEVAIAELTVDPDQGFVPAEGPEIDTLGRYLDRAGATTPMDQATEAGLIAQGWLK